MVTDKVIANSPISKRPLIWVQSRKPIGNRLIDVLLKPVKRFSKITLANDFIFNK